MKPALVAGALLLAATAAAQAADADPLYVAFSEVCAGPPLRYETMVADAKAHGWQEVGWDDYQPLHDFHQATFDEPEDDDPERATPFRRVLPAGEAFLVVRHMAVDGDVWSRCTVYDFNAKGPSGLPDLVARFGRDGKSIGKAAYGVSVTWEGEAKVPGEQWLVSVIYNPPGGIMTAIDGFIGAELQSLLHPAAAAISLE